MDNVLGVALTGYIVVVGGAILAFSSGSKAGIRFFRVLAVVLIPVLLMGLAYAFSHDDPAIVLIRGFLVALAIQFLLVIFFKPRAHREAPPPGLTGNAALMQDIHERNQLRDSERRRQQQRGRAMRAETENVHHVRRIRELEEENQKLRYEVRKLRTILADPFHDPIPMEEKI